MVTTRSQISTYQDNDLTSSHVKTNNKTKANGVKSQDRKQALESITNPKLRKLLSEHDQPPIGADVLTYPNKATPETVLAHLLNALISSARISHTIAANTLQELLTAGYHELSVLSSSTWDERTEILTRGGYTHYREKMATYLGDLATHLQERYEGDASRMLQADGRSEVLQRVKEVKGIGELGAELFLETVQGLRAGLAPSMSARNVEEAERLGLGDVDVIFEEVGCDGVEMARVCRALTASRLDK